MNEEEKEKIKTHDKQVNKNIVSNSDVDIKTVEQTIKVEENDSEEKNEVDTSSNFSYSDSDEDTGSETEETEKPKEILVSENQSESVEHKQDKKETQKNSHGESQAETEPTSRKTSEKKNVLKKITAVPLNIVKSGAKKAAGKVNPFDKKINKNDVSDSGVESVRLAYTSTKKTVKTVEQTIKTTQRTIKTTQKAISGTGKIIYKTGKFTGKVIVTAIKVTETVAVHVVASLMNPAIIVIVGAFFLLLMLLLMVVLLLSSAASAVVSNQNAYSTAAGLGNVAEQYAKGQEYFRIAADNRQAEFNAMIDNMYYDNNSLTTSSLVYMERTLPEPTIIYEKSFSTEERKNTLKSAWDISLTITETEALAIVYVYLEKQKNAEKQTDGGIYHVSYTQEVFDEILQKCVIYTDTVYEGQFCPDENCTRHVDYVPSPDWEYALNMLNEAANYDNQSTEESDLEYWGQQYEYWDNVLNSTSSTIEEVSYICEHQHSLHSIGLAFFTKEDIMNALEFTDNDKQWENLTEKGFESNPDITL